MVLEIKRTCHHVVIYYKICYGINHLKAYIIEKTTYLRVKTWGGGVKDMISPHVKTWGDISPPSPPPRIYALDDNNYSCLY